MVDEHDDLDASTQTTAAGLTRLAATIGDLLRERAIDSRLGAKLHRRLEKEAKRVSEHVPPLFTDEEINTLRVGLEELERALHKRDAELLVAANARLREREDAATKRRKGKKDEG
jgi:hypothetical protein